MGGSGGGGASCGGGGWGDCGDSEEEAIAGIAGDLVVGIQSIDRSIDGLRIKGDDRERTRGNVKRFPRLIDFTATQPPGTLTTIFYSDYYFLLLLR